MKMGIAGSGLLFSKLYKWLSFSHFRCQTQEIHFSFQVVELYDNAHHAFHNQKDRSLLAV